MVDKLAVIDFDDTLVRTNTKIIVYWKKKQKEFNTNQIKDAYKFAERRDAEIDYSEFAKPITRQNIKAINYSLISKIRQDDVLILTARGEGETIKNLFKQHFKLNFDVIALKDIYDDKKDGLLIAQRKSEELKLYLKQKSYKFINVYDDQLSNLAKIKGALPQVNIHFVKF